MSKLRLDIDALEIEAFDTLPEKHEDDEGTVRAHQSPTGVSAASCFDPTCRAEWESCGATCETCQETCDTCWNTCADTCRGFNGWC